MTRIIFSFSATGILAIAVLVVTFGPFLAFFVANWSLNLKETPSNFIQHALKSSYE